MHGSHVVIYYASIVYSFTLRLEKMAHFKTADFEMAHFEMAHFKMAHFKMAHFKMAHFQPFVNESVDEVHLF